MTSGSGESPRSGKPSVAPAELEATLRRVLEEDQWAKKLAVDTLVALCHQKFSEDALTKVMRAKGPSPEAVFNGRYVLLKYLTQDDSRSKWQAITSKDPKIDRDACIQGLWELIQDDPRLEELHNSAEYHRWVLFHWFLERYDPGRARAVWMPPTRPSATARLVRHIHFPLFLVMVALAVVMTQTALGWQPVAWAVPVVWGGAVFLQWWFFRKAGPRMAPFIAASSLIPRLGGTVLVGFLFLLSNQPVSRHVLGPDSHRTVACVALVFSTIYLMLEISRRVHPSLRFAVLLERAFVIVSTGASYALALAIAGLPAIRLAAQETNPRPAGLAQVVLIASIILTIGLVVNVIWSEDPVTKAL